MRCAMKHSQLVYKAKTKKPIENLHKFASIIDFEPEKPFPDLRKLEKPRDTSNNLLGAI